MVQKRAQMLELCLVPRGSCLGAVIQAWTMMTMSDVYVLQAGAASAGANVSVSASATG